MVETLVIDTGPLLEGFGAPPGVRCLVPERVLDELRKHGVTQYEVSSRGLIPAAPIKASVALVKATARETGDDGVLSEADVALLAIALDEKATLVTDDYAVQNVATHLGLKLRTFAQKGIERTIKWEWYCAACHSHVGPAAGECPVCGTALKRRPARGK